MMMFCCCVIIAGAMLRLLTQARLGGLIVERFQIGQLLDHLYDRKTGMTRGLICICYENYGLSVIPMWHGCMVKDIKII